MKPELADSSACCSQQDHGVDTEARPGQRSPTVLLFGCTGATMTTAIHARALPAAIVSCSGCVSCNRAARSCRDHCVPGIVRAHAAIHDVSAVLCAYLLRIRTSCAVKFDQRAKCCTQNGMISKPFAECRSNPPKSYHIGIDLLKHRRTLNSHSPQTLDHRTLLIMQSLSRLDTLTLRTAHAVPTLRQRVPQHNSGTMQRRAAQQLQSQPQREQDYFAVDKRPVILFDGVSLSLGLHAEQVHAKHIVWTAAGSLLCRHSTKQGTSQRQQQQQQ